MMSFVSDRKSDAPPASPPISPHPCPTAATSGRQLAALVCPAVPSRCLPSSCSSGDERRLAAP